MSRKEAKKNLEEKIRQIKEISGYVITGFLPEKFRSRNLVCFAKDKKNKEYAIKFSPDPDSIKREYEIMTKISHPNIMAANDFIEKDDFSSIVMPKAEGGDLYEVYRSSLNNYPYHLLQSQVQNVLRSLFLALDYIHLSGYIHRDVKMENIFIMGKTIDSKVVLGDLDLLVSSNDAKGECGTKGYAAPEIITHQPYDCKADIWSAGAVMSRLYFDRYPIEFITADQTFDYSVPCFYELRRETVDLLDNILCVDPSKRFTAKQALEHDYFKIDFSEPIENDVCHTINDLDIEINDFDKQTRNEEFE